MKSDRQVRAEGLAERFKISGRKPVVLEFAGVPKAGKTTMLSHVQAFMKRCGFRVEVVVERASVCPIRDKKHANFNVWTVCTTLAQILEKTQIPPRPEDPDILILDRGLFDSLCWLAMMERLSRLRTEDLEVIDQFLRIDDWKKRISAVIVMTASPTDSLEREKGYLPVEGVSGSIMNPDVLDQMLKITMATSERLRNEFRIHILDSSSSTLRDQPQKTAEKVIDIALDVIEGQLREEILYVSRSELSRVFDGRICLKQDDADAVINCFVQRGRFGARAVVEADADTVQALPVVVVRNKTGDVLRLRRKESDESNPLNEKLVIWAGGHVRAEDGSNGEAVVRCAVRELQEELRLSVELHELRLLGSLYISKGERTGKHVAIVFEWKADTNDVAVALSGAEFFERSGKSLSGRFVGIEDLVKDVVNSKQYEVWSREIVREFLAPDHSMFPPRLF